MTPIVIAGPTGSGKSELALRIALAVGGEIVNYDSIQIYRGFDIGSAKPSAADRTRVPHHLFDIVDADDEFNASDYARLARETVTDIERRGGRAILAGGTFFYLRALLSGLPAMPGRDEALRARLQAVAARPPGPARLHRWLSKIDPQSGRKIPPADRHRVERALEVYIASGRPISEWTAPSPESSSVMNVLKVALTAPRTSLAERLDARVDAMYAHGLVDETRALLGRFSADARPFGAIGYKEAAAFVHGDLPLDKAIAETKRRTRAYAKRQRTWLRAERNVHWIDATTPDETFTAAMRLIEDQA